MLSPLLLQAFQTWHRWTGALLLFQDCRRAPEIGIAQTFSILIHNSVCRIVQDCAVFKHIFRWRACFFSDPSMFIDEKTLNVPDISWHTLCRSAAQQGEICDPYTRTASAPATLLPVLRLPLWSVLQTTAHNLYVSMVTFLDKNGYDLRIQHLKTKKENISTNATLYNWVRPPKQGVLCRMSASASPHACCRAVVGEAGSSESIMDNCNSSFIQFHLAIATHSRCLENHKFPQPLADWLLEGL